MNDKLGKELVDNGEFDTNIDGWSQSSNKWSHDGSGAARWTPDDVGGPDPDALYQSISISTELSYQVSFNVSVYNIFGASIIEVSLGGKVIPVTGTGEVTKIVKAGSNGKIELIGRNIELGDSVSFASVSVKRVKERGGSGGIEYRKKIQQRPPKPPKTQENQYVKAVEGPKLADKIVNNIISNM